MKRRLKIFYVMGHLSYPLKVAQLVHAIGLLRHMAARHDCDVLGFTAEENDDLAATLEKIAREVQGINLLGIFPLRRGLSRALGKARCLASLRPPGFARWSNAAVRCSVESAGMSGKYDLVHLNWFSATAQYLPLVRNTPTVLTLTDAQSLINIEQSTEDSGKLGRLLHSAAAALYRRAERRLLPLATKVQAVSPVDRHYLKHFVPEAEIAVVPTFIPIDCENFYTKTDYKTTYPSIILPRPYGKGMLWFFRVVYPLLLKAIPGLRTTVLAQNLMPEAVAMLASLPSVSYTRWVDDFNAEMTRHHAVVLTEMSGAGLSTRAMMALALGCAVVGTPKSFRGMPFADGEGCFIKDNPSEFADAIVRVINDKALAERVAAEGRKAALAQFSYSRVMSMTEELYFSAIARFQEARCIPGLAAESLR